MKYLSLILILLIVACRPNATTPEKEVNAIQFQEKKVFQAGPVFADNQFDGARLNDFQQINDTTFRAIISPENKPVNNSPWYAFRLWSTKPMAIQLELQYTEHRHRFIPKMSSDGKTWQSMDKADVEKDSVKQKATIRLQLTPDTLWLSAQEVINTAAIYSWIDSLSQIPFSQKTEIGKSVQNRPIFSLEIKEGKGEKTIVLIGRQHPPEVPGGTIALEAFAESLLADTELAKKFRAQFQILMIPLLNPDGVDLGHWRHNANGVDLNRDWIKFSQIETQTVKSYLKQKTQQEQTKLSFGIDFHTSYSGPYLLVLDSLNAPKMSGIIPNWIQKIEQGIPNYQIDQRPRSQELPYCYNWLINEFGIEAVTYEEGDEIDRAVIKNRAEVYAQTLMEVLLAL